MPYTGDIAFRDQQIAELTEDRRVIAEALLACQAKLASQEARGMEEVYKTRVLGRDIGEGHTSNLSYTQSRTQKIEDVLDAAHRVVMGRMPPGGSVQMLRMKIEALDAFDMNTGWRPATLEEAQGYEEANTVS